MRLYHVSIGTQSGKCWFYPRVPKYRICGEDDTTKRICFSDSIERALAAVPDLDKAQNNWIVVYTFDVEENDPNLIHWYDVWKKHAVVDAYITHEYWYTQDVTLMGKCYETNLFSVDEERVFSAKGKRDILWNLIGYLRHRCSYSDDQLSSVRNKTKGLDANALFTFIKKEFPDISEDDIIIAGISMFVQVISNLQLVPMSYP